MTATATPPDRAEQHSTSTVHGGESALGAPENVTRAQLRRGRLLRRIILFVMVAFLVAGALNVFGVHTDTIKAEGGGYELQATYARTGRPGIGVPLDVEIKKDGGFEEGKPIKVSITKKYLDILAQFDFDPEPSGATQSDTELIWEFDPPPEDTFSFTFSTQLAPDQHAGSHPATISVLDDNDNPVVSAKISTWEWP